MATSVLCKQLFSIASPTIKKLRNRLTGNNTRVILFKKLVGRKNNLILQLYFSAN
ncbi:hypothetical protein RhiirC2_735725 [Rhizophagus irregularis]|uniref:Uncharacterized protein n=1 Tax=Rhizophagus irregularis TaxID=588596 RepID=A0A2N1NPF9_9GLOM|nr:hypothetical protein RhiirC2_735725 [Rhizophagus irregularis]